MSEAVSSHATTVIRPGGPSSLMDGGDPALSPGDLVGDYRVVKRLGSGGMGVVYLAEQQSLKRLVALKVLRASLLGHASHLNRFQREIHHLANISHPNIVSAIETGTDGDRLYVSMTFVPGDDLKERLRHGPAFTPQEALRVALELAKALRHAWDKHGIIHRDVKPANVIVTPEGEVKLMDLGISKRMGEDEDEGEGGAEVTQAGVLVGSPLYISPEQARGDKDLDFRTDIYSLGASLFHLLAGRPPFVADSSMAVVAMHLSAPLPDPAIFKPGLPHEVAPLLKKMMAKSKAERHASYGELIDELEVLLGRAPEPEPEPESEPEPELEPEPEPEPELGLEAAVPASSGVNARRLAVLLLLLVLFLAALAATVKKGLAAERRAEAERLFALAERFIVTNPPIPATLDKAREMLDAAIMAGDPPHVAKARKAWDQLQRRRLEALRQARESELAEALRRLESESNAFERDKRFDQAIRLWKDYRERGAFSKELEKQIDKNLDYLKNRKELDARGML